jgi:integrase
MAKKRLTDRTLRALKPAPPGKRYEIMDTDVSGLGVRVTDKRQRSFVLVTRYPGSRNPTRRALGEYPLLTLDAARKKARRWHELINRHIDPKEEEERLQLAELRKRANAFDVVAEEFIQRVLIGPHPEKPRQRRGRIVARELRQEFSDRWRDRPISSITRRDVIEVINEVVDRGALYQAHNLLGHVRAFFNWAIEAGDYGLEVSPCDRLKPKRLIGKKAHRTRVLTDAELGAVWRASERMGYPFGPLFQMLALTGQRKSEVANACWCEFDFPERLWTIPPERMKGDHLHVVPLAPAAVGLLEGLPRFNEGNYLFSTKFGVKPVAGFANAKKRLDQLVTEELGAAPPAFVLHDIRRTVRTALSALPVSDLVRELVIAHARPGLHKVYDQFAYIEEKRRALELWATRLQDIVHPSPKVVRLQIGGTA